VLRAWLRVLRAYDFSEHDAATFFTDRTCMSRSTSAALIVIVPSLSAGVGTRFRVGTT